MILLTVFRKTRNTLPFTAGCMRRCTDLATLIDGIPQPTADLGGAPLGTFDRVALHSGAMNRNSGIGLTSFGIVLVVVGAILRFAVSVHTSGFNIHKVGDILLLVGILLVILSVLVIVMGGRSRSTSRTEVRETPSGQQRTEQRDDWGAP